MSFLKKQLSANVLGMAAISFLYFSSSACGVLPLSSESDGGQAEVATRPIITRLSDAIRSKGMHDTIAAAMRGQCARSFPGQNFLKCSFGGQKMAKALDYGFISGEGDSAHAAFRSDLLELLSGPNAMGVRYLSELKSSIQKIGFGVDAFSLWNFSLNFASNDPALATKLIAVLLQDTSPESYFVRYVSLHPKMGSKTAEELAETLQVFRQTVGLKTYPQLPSEVKGKMYHFYVMAHAAVRMKKAGADRKEAFFYPFAFNTSYEMNQKLNPVDVYQGLVPKWLLKRTAILEDFNALTKQLMQEVKPFVLSSSGIEHDMYLGYAGSFFGTMLAENRSVEQALPTVRAENFSVALASKGSAYFTKLVTVVGEL